MLVVISSLVIKLKWRHLSMFLFSSRCSLPGIVQCKKISHCPKDNCRAASSAPSNNEIFGRSHLGILFEFLTYKATLLGRKDPYNLDPPFRFQAMYELNKLDYQGQ